MERADIIRLLPCYRRGQLEPDAADHVRRALHEDPSLRELLAAIQDAERLCAATLRAGAPADLRSLKSLTDRSARLAGGWGVLCGLVVGVALLLLVLIGDSHTVRAGALEPLEDHLIAARIDGPDLIPAADPAALVQALRAAGVDADRARVTDLSWLGLTLDGARVQDGQVAVVWRDDRGAGIVCVRGPRLPVHRTPDAVHRPDTGVGPVLQGHALPGLAAVYWEQDGEGLAMVSAGELDALTALAFRVVWTPAG